MTDPPHLTVVVPSSEPEKRSEYSNIRKLQSNDLHITSLFDTTLSSFISAVSLNFGVLTTVFVDVFFFRTGKTGL